MSYSDKLVRYDALTEAIQAVTHTIGEAEPSPQALAILEAIKRLRDGKPLRLTSTDRIDYLGRLQEAARTAWAAKHNGHGYGPAFDATEGIDTPLGRLTVTTWRNPWRGKRGERIAWAGEYYLDDEPITLAEIKAAGLAQRPTSRNRRPKADRLANHS